MNDRFKECFSKEHELILVGFLRNTRPPEKQRDMPKFFYDMWFFCFDCCVVIPVKVDEIDSNILS